MDWKRLLHQAAIWCAAATALFASMIKDAHEFGSTLAILLGAYVIARAVRNK